MKKIFFIVLYFLSFSSLAATKTLALSIDDLPFVGDEKAYHLNLILETLIKAKVPATGFIIADKLQPLQVEVIEAWKDKGLSLGSHSLTHANLGALSLAGYTKEIVEADNKLAPYLTAPKLFRFPYLSMGQGEKRQAILALLKRLDYTVAPITIDSKDFTFNQKIYAIPEAGRWAYLTELKPLYLDFIWSQTQKAEATRPGPQILLIHANLLNAYVLEDIIKLYKEKGYHFISLEQALGVA